MAERAWIENYLDNSGVKYVVLHHKEAFTSQSMAQEEHMSGYRTAKVVIVMADGKPVACVLPACRYLEIDRVKEMIAAKELHLASEQEISLYFSDVEVGAIPPLRHWNNIELWMDSTMERKGSILFHAGTHREAIRMDFSDWFQLAKPRVASFSKAIDNRLKGSFRDESK